MRGILIQVQGRAEYYCEICNPTVDQLNLPVNKVYVIPDSVNYNFSTNGVKLFATNSQADEYAKSATNTAKIDTANIKYNLTSDGYLIVNGTTKLTNDSYGYLFNKKFKVLNNSYTSDDYAIHSVINPKYTFMAKNNLVIFVVVATLKVDYV